MSRRSRRPRVDADEPSEAPRRPGALCAPVRLARRVANWPAGTPVTVVEPFGRGVMVEVENAAGETLDVLVVRRQILTI